MEGRDPERYYVTLAHETTHWTCHPTRLDSDFGRTRWGDDGYAREELLAELGAAFLCADLGLELEPRPDHASYIHGWLKALKEDRRFIFTAAAAHAQRAADPAQPGHAARASRMVTAPASATDRAPAIATARSPSLG